MPGREDHGEASGSTTCVLVDYIRPPSHADCYERHQSECLPGTAPQTVGVQSLHERPRTQKSRSERVENIWLRHDGHHRDATPHELGCDVDGMSLHAADTRGLQDKHHPLGY
jgi:hypothetical protein